MYPVRRKGGRGSKSAIAIKRRDCKSAEEYSPRWNFKLIDNNDHPRLDAKDGSVRGKRAPAADFSVVLASKVDRILCREYIKILMQSSAKVFSPS